MRIYICGPMTGLPEHNYPAFAAATGALVDAGYDVSSPHEIVITKPHGEPTWHDYMRAAVRMLTHCDAIAVLPGWERSRGALVEIDLASALGMPVHEVAHWVEKAPRVVTP